MKWLFAYLAFLLLWVSISIYSIANCVTTNVCP